MNPTWDFSIVALWRSHMGEMSMPASRSCRSRAMTPAKRHWRMKVWKHRLSALFGRKGLRRTDRYSWKFEHLDFTFCTVLYMWWHVSNKPIFSDKSHSWDEFINWCLFGVHYNFVKKQSNIILSLYSTTHKAIALAVCALVDLNFYLTVVIVCSQKILRAWRKLLTMQIITKSQFLIFF